MKLEKAKNVVAVLRVILGMTQKELADLIHVSINTVQSIETNRIPLSDSIASKISLETGVSINWLLAGALNAKPMTTSGVPFTKASYQGHRTCIEVGKLKPHNPIEKSVFTLFCANVAIATILSRAQKEGNLDLYCWETMAALSSILGKITGQKKVEMSSCGSEQICSLDSQLGIIAVVDNLIDALKNGKEFSMPVQPMPPSPEK